MTRLLSLVFIGAAILPAVVSAAEYPIGTPLQRNGIEIAALYLQPVVMEPEGMMRSPAEFDVHIEADIAASGSPIW